MSRHFRLGGSSSAALEEVGAPGPFGLGEDGLDHWLAPLVEALAGVPGEDPAHEVVDAAARARPGPGPFVGIRGASEGDDRRRSARL